MKLRTLLIAFGLVLSFASTAQESNTRRGCLDELDVPRSIAICGDGVNTTWGVHFPCAPEKFSVTVMNRWGEELYTSKDYKFQWLPVDASGKQLPSGEYRYIITCTYLGEEKTLEGMLAVIC